LRVFFADMGNVAGLVVLPVVLTLILGIASGGGGASDIRLRVDLLDLDNTPESAQILASLRTANASLYFCPMDDSETTNCNLEDDETLTLEVAQQRVRDGVTEALIVIPAGYAENLQAFEPIAIDYYSLADAVSGDIVLTALDAVVLEVNGAIVAARVGVQVGDNFDPDSQTPIFEDAAARAEFSQKIYDRAANYLAQKPLTIDYAVNQEVVEEEISAATAGFGQSVPGQGSTFVMFTVLGGLFILIRERKQTTLQRLVVMPITRAQILAGKALTYCTLGMIQYVIVFIVGVFSGMDFGDAPLAILLTMVAFVVCVAALTFALATRISTEGQANGVSLLLSMTLAPLGGAWWPIEITPPFMQTIAQISPVYWAMRGFKEVIFYQGTLTDVLVPVGVLLAAAVVLFWIGVRGFKYG
jgi:ABC-2 type transport system permease protein